MIIAFTGRRHAGKSTAAKYLRDKHGFVPAHAFGIGKRMAEQYFFEVTGHADLADRMVNGDLKDQPSEYLPGNATPRLFMERFGQFMGVQMGPEWTLGMEVRRYGPGVDLVFESIIYESEPLRKMGAVIVRLGRLGYDHPSVDSDATQAAIKAHHTILAGSLDELRTGLDDLVDRVRVAFG